MKFQIYHQLGHNPTWNFESIEEDSTGDGVILSPMSMDRGKMVKLPGKTRESAIFDPQFFLPDEAKRGLATYDFFPKQVADGFITSDYEDFAPTSAELCVNFQAALQFARIVIPTRYMRGTPTNFIEMQTELFVEPFIQAINRKNPNVSKVLQVIFSDSMIQDKEYSAELLNWITGIQEISGVYLITEVQRRGKQIANADFLSALLQFIYALSSNGMQVILGYLNTESLLLSLAEPWIVTMGTYENTRIFNVNNFIEEKDDKKKGGGSPSARLYVPTLLQNVDSGYLQSIKKELKVEDEFFGDNPYRTLAFDRTPNWHFTKPELYKHQFIELSRQLRDLSGAEGRDRYVLLVAMIHRAMDEFEKLKACGVVLDNDSSGAHLTAWLTAANLFANSMGWRS